MKYSELEKLLRKNGCYQIREGKRHEIWYSPKTGKQFTIGRHESQDVRKGTLKQILKDAGIE